MMLVSLVLPVFSGCGNSETTQGTEKVKLTYWAALPTNVSQFAVDMNELEFYKELEKRTNVEIDFIHPSSANVSEQFNVMLASGDYPDIIERDWSSYTGGEEQAYKDGILMDLTDLMEANMPNMLNYIDTVVPESKKWVTTNGRFYTIPNLSDNEKYTVMHGPVIRKDLLDKCGLEIPKTITDWENVLRAFKNEGIASPLVFFDTNSYSVVKSFAQFIGAYGIARNFFVDPVDGKVKHGFADERIKEFINTMRKWIDEGLLDPDITTIDSKGLEGKIYNGEAGAWTDNVSTLRARETELKRVLPEAELAVCPYPTLNEGETCLIVPFDRMDGYTYSGMVGISTANENPEITLQWLDYAFSEEGHMLYNFGLEGISYNIEDGKPVYTELITNNPDGYDLNTALANYARPNAIGYLDAAYLEQYYDSGLQQQALQTWSADGAKTRPSMVWRACYKFTAEEAEEYNSLVSQINTYVDEKYARLISGIDSIDHYEEFIAELETMQIDRVCELIQTAYDRALAQ